VLVDASAGGVPRALSFPVPRARAVGGAIVAGDRIDAVAVDRGSARARFVLVGAEILAVDHDAGGPLAATDDVVVTVAVDAPSALRLAGALESGTLTLVRATGAVALDDAGPSERTQ
jgi:Flp pilus assembly protein CpaB